MSIKRGTNTIRRKNAKNFTHDVAQKRLDETLDPFRKQVTNSLEVDAVEIDYYCIQRKVGAPCSCGMVHSAAPLIRDQGGDAIVTTVPNKHGVTDNAKIQFQDDNIFGEDLGQRIYDDDDFDDEASDSVLDVSGGSIREIEPEESHEGSLNGGGVNCGICYRTQHLPPYKAVDKQRFLFTHFDIQTCSEYFVDSTKAPHTIARQGAQSSGYVAFLLTVPKYFKDVLFSVRNNLTYLPAEKLYRADGEPFTADDLRVYAGREVTFFVKAAQFTHVVIEFGVDVEPLKANISAESQSLDYGRLMTIGDIQVVLPPRLTQVENGDILIIKKRNLALLVRDKEWKATADRRTFGWRVSTRVLQPGEPMRTLGAGIKLK